jgi:hypothetical protein
MRPNNRTVGTSSNRVPLSSHVFLQRLAGSCMSRRVDSERLTRCSSSAGVTPVTTRNVFAKSEPEDGGEGVRRAQT